MRDAGIADGARLRVSIHPSNPEVFVIFVTLPNGTQINLNLTEVGYHPCVIIIYLYCYRNSAIQNYTDKLNREWILIRPSG